MVNILASLAGPWRLYAELAVGAALLAALGAQTVRLAGAEKAEARAEAAASTARAATADVRRQWAEQAAAAASAGLAASERNRALGAELQRTKEEAEHARKVDRAAAARTAAGLAAERDGLRRQLAAYAAGPAGRGGAANDSLAACRDRADTLGRLLGEGLRIQDELAGGAEAEAGNVRALLSSWPRAKVKLGD